MEIDYKNSQIKDLLADSKALALLEAVKEYPMSSIDDLLLRSDFGPNNIPLSVPEARTILNKLEISSQTQRVMNLPKVLKVIEKVKNRNKQKLEKNEIERDTLQEITVNEKITEIAPIDYKPEEIVSIIQSPAVPLPDLVVSRPFEKKPKKEKPPKPFLNGLKLNVNPMYFVLIFFILIALIYWLFTAELYKPDSGLLRDSSLPVNNEKTAQ